MLSREALRGTKGCKVKKRVGKSTSIPLFPPLPSAPAHTLFMVFRGLSGQYLECINFWPTISISNQGRKRVSDFVCGWMFYHGGRTHTTGLLHLVTAPRIQPRVVKTPNNPIFEKAPSLFTAKAGMFKPTQGMIYTDKLNGLNLFAYLTCPVQLSDTYSPKSGLRRKKETHVSWVQMAGWSCVKKNRMIWQLIISS